MIASLLSTILGSGTSSPVLLAGSVEDDRVHRDLRSGLRLAWKPLTSPAGGSWPVTRNDPALGMKTDWAPESQRTVINRPSTAMTTPLRVRVPTFSDSTTTRSPTSTMSTSSAGGATRPLQVSPAGWLGSRGTVGKVGGKRSAPYGGAGRAFGGYCRARSGGDGSCSRPRCCDGIATWCGAAGLPPPAWPWRSDARPRRGLSIPRTKQMQHRLRRCWPSTLTITTATARTAPWSRHRHSRPGVPVALAPPARIVRRDRLGGLIHEYAQAA
jgi:hypothetical protein